MIYIYLSLTLNVLEKLMTWLISLIAKNIKKTWNKMSESDSNICNHFFPLFVIFLEHIHFVVHLLVNIVNNKVYIWLKTNLIIKPLIFLVVGGCVRRRGCGRDPQVIAKFASLLSFYVLKVLLIFFFFLIALQSLHL